jgi:small subunit ribosomal protein S18
MARGTDRSTNRRAAKDAARRTKKKPCALCRDKVEWVDYKDVGMLRKYMSDRGKIRARRVSGNCAQHQREVALAIKTARELVLLPYTQRTVTERSGRGRGSGGGRDRGPRGVGAEETASRPPATGSPELEGDARFAEGNGDGSAEYGRGSEDGDRAADAVEAGPAGALDGEEPG